MAKTDIWMPVYIGDYLGDTQHLNAEKHGIYFLLMMHYWKQGPFDNDIESLACVARTTEDKITRILEGFFHYENGLWRHKRIDKELDNAKSRSDSARANAKKRWDKQKQCDGNAPAYANGDAESMRNRCSSSSSSSSQLHSKASSQPHPKDVLGEVWKYWNGKNNLPNDPYMPTSMSDPRRLLDVVNGHTLERVKECIDKLDRLYPSLDKKPGSPGGLLSNNSITYWLNAKEETKETMSQEEMEKFAEEVFG